MSVHVSKKPIRYVIMITLKPKSRTFPWLVVSVRMPIPVVFAKKIRMDAKTLIHPVFPEQNVLIKKRPLVVIFADFVLRDIPETGLNANQTTKNLFRTKFVSIFQKLTMEASNGLMGMIVQDCS